MILQQIKEKLQVDNPTHRKKRIIQTVCALIILALAFTLGLTIGHNRELSQYEIIKIKSTSAEYKEAEEKLNLVKADLSKDTNTLNEFKKYKNDIDKANSSLVSLQAKEKELQGKVDTLLASLDAKQKELDLATANVTKAAGAPKKLPAGYYTVGKHIPSGRYIITGSSNLFVYDNSGIPVINTILGRYGVPEYCATISDGMTIQTEGGATFTPAAN